MISIARVTVFLLSALGAGARRNVTFERREALDPCDDDVLVFTTVGTNVSEIEHAFRLNCTDTLFVSRNLDDVPTWNAARGVPSLSTELSFFRQQAEVIATAFGVLLEQSTRVELSYEFNTATQGYYCYLFLADYLVSSCKSGMPYYYPALGRFEKYRSIVSRVKMYSRGVGIDILKGAAGILGDKWRNFCEMVKALENNATDEYALRYDEHIGGLVCSIRSRTQWRHRVFFGQTPATETTRIRDRDRYATVGMKGHDPETESVCNITFPDGTIALQIFEPPRRTETPSPSPTTAGSTAPLSTLSVTPSRGETQDDETADGPSDPGVETAAVAIPIVLIVVLILSGIGLFVSRDRLERAMSDFRPIPTEGS